MRTRWMRILEALLWHTEQMNSNETLLYHVAGPLQRLREQPMLLMRYQIPGVSRRRPGHLSHV